jgi:hypothetical protein
MPSIIGGDEFKRVFVDSEAANTTLFIMLGIMYANCAFVFWPSKKKE